MQEEVTRNGRFIKITRIEDGFRLEREQEYRTAPAADKVYTLLMFDKDARATFLRNRETKRTQL